MAQKKSGGLSNKAKKLKKRIEQLDLPAREKMRAIAVKYEAKKGKAPRIIATGKGAVAERILEIAEEHKVPFFEDRTLTDLLAKLDLETEVPPEMYTLVAEVLAFVYQLDKLAKKGKGKRRKFVKR